MGYDVHITRRADWSDKDEPAISLAEWLNYIDADPEMRLDGYAEANLKNGSKLRMEDPSMAVWLAHPEHGKHDGMAWIWLSHGNVQAKNPDEAMLKKMWSISRAFGARVQGDEGEHYNSDGQMASHEIDTQPREPESAIGTTSAPAKKPWWRVW